MRRHATPVVEVGTELAVLYVHARASIGAGYVGRQIRVQEQTEAVRPGGPQRSRGQLQGYVGDLQLSESLVFWTSASVSVFAP